jgi:glucose/arabinose dehydrogenase
VGIAGLNLQPSRTVFLRFPVFNVALPAEFVLHFALGCHAGALPCRCCVGTVVTGSLNACSREAPPTTTPPADGARPAASPVASSQRGCDPGNGGLTLPEGFCASVFADNLGHARHLVVAPNGDVYVNTMSTKSSDFMAPEGGMIVGLRDSDHDGHAESIQRFGDHYVPGQPAAALHRRSQRRALRRGRTRRSSATRSAATWCRRRKRRSSCAGLPKQGDHGAHPFAIAPDGALYVNSGSATNACQMRNRVAGSRGMKPCPELTTRAGIWQYDAGKTDQVFSSTERFATGLRNTVAMAVMPATTRSLPRSTTRSAQRQLARTLQRRTEQRAARLSSLCAWRRIAITVGPIATSTRSSVVTCSRPSLVADGGKAVGDCQKLPPRPVAFPAHWAPMAIAFYAGQMFPPAYQRGAFVSFHGSWNRTPAQSGLRRRLRAVRRRQADRAVQEFARGLRARRCRLIRRPPRTGRWASRSALMARSTCQDDLNGRVWKIIHTRGQ